MAADPQPADSNVPGNSIGKARSLGAWAEVLTVFSIAAFLAVSYFTGKVRFFVAPSYIWFSLAAAVALFAMGIARLRAHFDGYTPGEMEEQSAWQVPLWACVIVLFVPIVLALKENPTGYSSEGLVKRRVPLPPYHAELADALDWVQGLQAADKKAAAATVSLPKDPNILDLLDVVRQGRQKGLEGQFVKVTGQCVLPDGPGSKRFDLYRLVVTCCIADATAVSVEIARRSTDGLEGEGWVRVEGIIKFDSKFDPSQPVIHATTTAKIPEPSEPFL